MKCLPIPKGDPAGILAAFEMYPFNYDETEFEHDFQAYGVTLATENCHGKLVYLHGDAIITIIEPTPGDTVVVPGRDHTNRIRQKMFNPGKCQKNPRTKPRSKSASSNIGTDANRFPEVSEAGWNALNEELKKRPMVIGEPPHKYLIEETHEGMIVVRAKQVA